MFLIETLNNSHLQQLPSQLLSHAIQTTLCCLQCLSCLPATTNLLTMTVTLVRLRSSIIWNPTSRTTAQAFSQ